MLLTPIHRLKKTQTVMQYKLVDKVIKQINSNQFESCVVNNKTKGINIDINCVLSILLPYKRHFIQSIR